MEGATAIRHPSMRRIAIVAATALASTNVWTGAPLLAVWTGAQLQHDSRPRMGSAFAVILVLAIAEIALGFALAWLGARYDEISERPIRHRRTSPWLQSMSGERPVDVRREAGVSAVERTVAISVVAAVLCFEIWFFFFAGSPI
jgi:hypothetical protein